MRHRPAVLHRRQRPPSLFVLHACMAVLLGGPAGAALASPSVAWEGRLEVLQAQGRDCPAGQQVPYAVAVQGVQDAGGLLLWGGMQTAALQPVDGGPMHAIGFLDAPGAGQATLAATPRSLAGEWREQAAPDGSGCTYALGRLHLARVDDAAQSAIAAHMAGYLRALHGARAGVLAAATRQDARAHAEVLDRLAAQLPPAGEADQGIAQAFLDAARQLAGLRDRAAALRLAQASSTLYRRSASGAPEPAALALAAHARLAWRSGPAAAAALLDEGLALLARHDRLDTAAAASLWNQQGAWRRRAGDLGGAVASFGRAVLAEERRQAPPFELALALNNLGATLRDAGEPDRARQCLERALVLAQGQQGDQARLADVIREHLGTLDAPAQGGPQRT